MGFVRIASVALVGLVGCAGVLGFEDIVVDNAIGGDAGDVGTSGTPGTSSGTSGTSGSSGTSGGPVADGAATGRCPPTSAFSNPRSIAEIRTKNDPTDPVDLNVKLSQDELTMTWMHQVSAPGAALTLAPFIATRNKITDSWSSPTTFGANGGASIFAPSPSDDGLTFYFSFTSSGTTRRLVSAPKNMLAQRMPLALMPDADDAYVIRSDRTDEAFFSSNRDPAAPPTGALGTGPYFIYRAPGPWGLHPLDVKRVELVQDLTVATSDILWLLEPVLSGDALDLYYTAYTQATASAFPKGRGLFVASRAAVGEAFGGGRLVEGVDVDRQRLGWLSPDGCRGYFYMTDPGADVATGTHIHVLERTPQ